MKRGQVGRICPGSSASASSDIRGVARMLSASLGEVSLYAQPVAYHFFQFVSETIRPENSPAAFSAPLGTLRTSYLSIFAAFPQ